MSGRRPSLLVLAVLLGLGLGGRGTAGGAQASPGAGRPTGGRASGPSAQIGPSNPIDPTDTALGMGRRSFDTYAYRTPLACLAAARGADAVARRTLIDSGVYQPEHDSVSAAAIDVIRRCGTRFTVANTAPADLLDLAHLALMTGADSTARAAADRYVAAATDPVAHRWALYAVDTMYFDAHPLRLAAAEATTARLDSLGAAAVLQRNLAHGLLYRHARAHYDVPRLEREALTLLRFCHALSATDLQDVDGACEATEATWNLFLVEVYQAAQGALERTQRLLATTGFSAQEQHQFQQFLQQLRLDWFVQRLGTPIPPLQAPYWAGAPGAPHTWPVPGKVSVYLLHVWESNGPEQMGHWRRLAAKYGSALAITILVPARGSFHNGPPLTPAEEVVRLARYYREQLGVPVTVAVAETPVEQLPPPDGRRIRGQSPILRDPYYGAHFLLADRTGKLLLGIPLGALEEPLLDAWLARAVGHDAGH